tara:strand:+ start:100 stop:855 length:756 start_codon:yes stop_codon:yes gene_type:complete
MAVALYQPLGCKPDDFFRAPGSDERDEAELQRVGGDVDVYVAPSVVRGRQKYQRMLKSDSPDVSWKVSLKTDRRARTMYGEELPAGFPHLHEFFTSAKSLRVFAIGFEVYRCLYDEPQFWKRWHSDVTNIAEWEVQALRSEILRKFSPPLNGGVKPTRVMVSILRFTVEKGLWPLSLTASMPKRVRLEVRWGVLRWACKVRKYGLVWMKNHADVQEEARIRKVKAGEYDDVQRCISTLPPSSPSLKRRRVA